MDQRQINEYILASEARVKKIFEDYLANFQRRNRNGVDPAVMAQVMALMQDQAQPAAGGLPGGEDQIYGPDGG